MILTAYLSGLLALLVGLLSWRKIPRRTAFDIVHLSAWIFALTSFLSLQVMSRTASQFLDGLVPFLPPVIPVALFVAWSLHRINRHP
jgi:hypothetical protein